jgi:hypothetical protein
MEKRVYEAGEKVTLYMNLYKAGWFHRKGKPGTVDIHPGDFYPNRGKAVAEIDRPELYLGTIPFEYEVPEDSLLVVNDENSVAIPLSVSRRRHVAEMKAKGVDILKDFANAELAAMLARQAEYA